MGHHADVAEALRDLILQVPDRGPVHKGWPLTIDQSDVRDKFLINRKGNWNATTNTPALADGTGDEGDYYRVTVAGTQDLGSGPLTFAIGDAAIYNGAIWEKSTTLDIDFSILRTWIIQRTRRWNEYETTTETTKVDEWTLFGYYGYNDRVDPPSEDEFQQFLDDVMETILPDLTIDDLYYTRTPLVAQNIGLKMFCSTLCHYVEIVFQGSLEGTL